MIPLNSAARNTPAGSQPVRAELWSRIYSRVGSYWKGLVLATLLADILYTFVDPRIRHARART